MWSTWFWILNQYILSEASGLGLGLEAIIQLGSTAGLGALAWYLIVKVNPEKDRDHRKEREAEHVRWIEERGTFLAVIANRDVKFIEAIEKRDAQLEKLTREWMSMVVRFELAMRELQSKDSPPKESDSA